MIDAEVLDSEEAAEDISIYDYGSDLDEEDESVLVEPDDITTVAGLVTK